MADDKIIHPNVKDSRVLTYLNQRNKPQYINSDEENLLLELWEEKYNLAKSEYEKSRANSKMVKYWRQAYEGKFKQLDKNGEMTNKDMKAVRKLAFELVEGKISSHIPAPKMSPRYYSDFVPVNATEHLIKHEIDHILSEDNNDRAEHHAVIDGMVWFKVNWNPFDNTHERSGNPEVKVCPIDTVFPQPGILNYKDLEYIFEDTFLTVAQAIDLYGREIQSPNGTDLIPVINCYYLNENRYVGKFSWCSENGTVLCNDLEWGIRRRRECTKCYTICPIETQCPNCGSKNIKYRPVDKLILEEDLISVVNPYRSGTSNDANEDRNEIGGAIPAGTEIPHYLIRQLPFVPYRRITVPNSLYGISEVELILENQDVINKLLNKAEIKSSKSKTYVTKLKDTRINDSDDEEITLIEVESPQEGQSIQVKQIVSDIREEITQSQMLYEIAKSTVGTTDTDQGKNDPSARSGKAKQLQMAASAQRLNSPISLRNLAYSGIYELIFKNLLAYSDEQRAFVSLLPNGSKKEETWSKYMFLSKGKNGDYYYRDDFAWSVDTASEITQDRASMWQLIDNDFINGTLGSAIDPNRALMMYWRMKEQMGYPLAKFAIAFLEEAQQHLPTEVEQALVNNPEAVKLALSYIQDTQEKMGLGNSKAGGARTNAGRPSSGVGHRASVEKTNNANRTESGAAQTTSLATASGGMQGGTGGPSLLGGNK